jgi:hypothetical protein
LRIFLLACSAIVLGACAVDQTEAQTATQPAAVPAPPPPAIPEQGDPVPTAGQPAGPAASLVDLTGKLIYAGGGHTIGTVISMSKGARGEQYAVVTMDKVLGLGGKNLLFPVSSLALKNRRGYATSLSSSQIKRLPETQSSTP